MKKHFQIIAAVVCLACLAASCRTARQTRADQSRHSFAHSTAGNAVEWQLWQRNIDFDSIIISLPLEGATDENLISCDSMNAPSSPATLAQQRPCGTRVAYKRGTELLPQSGRTVKVYGMSLSDFSASHSNTSCQSFDSLEVSRQTKTQAPATETNAHRALWPLMAAILLVGIAVAILFYSRRRQ